MSGNQVGVTFTGDTNNLVSAANNATQATQGVTNSVTQSSNQMANAAQSSSDLSSKLGSMGSATSGAMDAFDAVGSSLTALNDIQNYSANKVQREARLLADVEQASLDLQQAYGDLKQAQADLTQSMIDGRQGGLDAKQALIDARQASLDAEVAQKDYNDAVKEHGKNSAEAKQAAIDLTQAQADLEQANLDGEQAQADIKQATLDGGQANRDAAQAARDAKDSQLDLNDANTAAHPPELQKWADNLALLTPLLSAVVGIIGLVAAAQWLWNSALFASPVTWIVVGIIALIAVIVLIATKTTWFQDIWNAAWGGIKDAAAAVGSWFRDTLWGVYIKGTWDGIVAGVMWLKDMVVFQFTALKDAVLQIWGYITGLPQKLGDAFSKITDYITRPFRTAFNYVVDAWNNTIGRLSWSVPDWVPFIGGNSISAPRLPKYHTGGIVPGVFGAETLAVLQAGEQVIPAGGGGDGGGPIIFGSDGSDFGDFILNEVRKAVNRRGGDPIRVLGNSRG